MKDEVLETRINPATLRRPNGVLGRSAVARVAHGGTLSWGTGA